MAMLFEVMRWVGAAYLVWLGIQAWRQRRRHRHGKRAARTGALLARLRGGAVQPEDDRILHRVPAAVRRSRAASRTPACGDVRRVGAAGRMHRFRLGGGRRARPGVVPENLAGEAARTIVRRGADRRWPLAVAGTSAGLKAAAVSLRLGVRGRDDAGPSLHLGQSA